VWYNTSGVKITPHTHHLVSGGVGKPNTLENRGIGLVAAARVYCVKSIIMQGGATYVKNVSAKEEATLKGAWFSQENVYQKWSQGACEAAQQGQSEAFCVNIRQASG